jgi:uncharacterized protein YndB with AHSA1/START domain
MRETIAAKGITSDRELSISRLLNAPRHLVWKVWTEPEHIKQWWGPDGFNTTIHKMEVKKNGPWEFIMHGPDGKDYRNESVFVEIIKPEKIVYDHGPSPKFRATITFSEQGNKTLMNFTMVFATVEEKEQTVKVFKADEGQKQTVIRLEKYLEKNIPVKELTMTRIFKAPREVVFNAWVDTKELAKWWGPGGFTNPVCEFNAKPGGKIYIEMKAPDGVVYPMNGTVEEMIKPSKLIFICGALDTEGNRLFDVMNTVLFEEENGNTKLTLHASVSEVRTNAMHYLDGMNEGWSQSLVRLEELVTK